MKIKEERINNELTLLILGDFKKLIEVSKHRDFGIGSGSFWRVDYAGKTISTLHRTKAEAMKSARKYIKDNFK